MNTERYRAGVIVTAFLLAPLAHSAAPPPFDVAYRAWELVTQLARHNADPALSGECGKTFRPFVIPGLRRQNRQQEDIAAAACVDTARSVCANSMLVKSAGIARKCEEFR